MIHRERVIALLEAMRHSRLVVVGDAMLDIYLIGDVDRISPEAPVPVVNVHERRYALGGAANVAANVAAIGADVTLVAAIGDDRRGEQLRTELAAAGIRYNAAVLVGPIAETIVAHAKKARCDLIFIGTHGRTAAGNMLLGSVATKVLHIATVPVLLVR